MTQLISGEVLGIYQVLRHLQSGGMGDIYEVYNTQLDRHEAMKVLKPELASQPDFVTRFIGEARKNARLDHPNIVPVYQISEPEARPVYFTMKLIQGQTLKEWYLGRLPLSEQVAAEMMLQITDALTYAHGQGLIHRDLKPANLMFDSDQRLYLMDFGIARAAQDIHLTQTGTQMGTAAYMSPEQAQDAKAVDARSDLYSLGVMLFEMLTGRTPFESDSAIGMAIKHVQELIPNPRSLNPALSAGMTQLVQHLLEKDPAKRPASAQELRNILKSGFNLQTGQLHFSQGSSPIKAFTPIPGFVTKQPIVLLGSLVLLLGLGIGVVIYGTHQQPAEKQATASTPAPTKVPDMAVPVQQSVAPTQTPVAPTQTPVSRSLPEGQYPQTLNRQIADDDLIGLSCDDLANMRNEIFARHGRPFQDPSLRSHFQAQSWYRIDPNYYDGMINGLEKRNAGYILETEKSRGCL